MHWDWTFEDAKQSMAHEVTTMVPLIRNDNDNDNNDDHHDHDNNHDDDFEDNSQTLR